MDVDDGECIISLSGDLAAIRRCQQTMADDMRVLEVEYKKRREEVTKLEERVTAVAEDMRSTKQAMRDSMKAFAEEVRNHAARFGALYGSSSKMEILAEIKQILQEGGVH